MKRQSELAHIKSTFNFDTPHLRGFGIEEEFSRCFLSNIAQFAEDFRQDSPDLYMVYKNKVIGIEHFEYDASRKNSKGSTERHKVDQIDKSFNRKARIALINGNRTYREEYSMNTDSSVESLKNNFLMGLRKHVMKIKKYKSNLQQQFPSNDPELWLMAEDTSMMGPTFYNCGLKDGVPDLPLLPVFYDEVQKEILDSEVNGIILMSTFPVSSYIAFIANNPHSFTRLRSYYHFDENMPIQFFNGSTYACSAFLVGEIEQ